MEKKKVLVVDDETDLLTLVKLNLEETGRFEVGTLSSAKDLVSEVHNFVPDIIVMDLLMPGIGGIEACEILNRDYSGKNIPIIILSALDKDTDKLKAFKVGVVDYAVKPIEKDDIIAKIDKALRFK